MKPLRALALRAQDSESLYELDFFQWTQRTAELLRRHRFEQIDLEHVVEEIEDMGKRDFREASSRLQVLLLHLLRWKMQARKRSQSWRRTILAQRAEIAGVLLQSPSLRGRLKSDLPRVYGLAAKRASLETGIPLADFPETCPFSPGQVFDDDYFPE